MNALRIAGVRKSFGFRAALAGVDLEVGSGEFLALFGPNGAGKTTLMKCVSGLARPTAGTVEVFGADPRKNHASRKRIGFVSHAGFLHDSLTGRENLRLYGRLYDVENLDARIDATLGEVSMQGRADDPVRSYSRGMRQRLAIARATVHDPDLLLLDEPFTGLDRHAQSELADHLRALVRDGRTVVLVTHELHETLSLATRVAVLVSGKLVLDRERGPEESSQSFVDEYLQLAGAPTHGGPS